MSSSLPTPLLTALLPALQVNQALFPSSLLGIFLFLTLFLLVTIKYDCHSLHLNCSGPIYAGTITVRSLWCISKYTGAQLKTGPAFSPLEPSFLGVLKTYRLASMLLCVASPYSSWVLHTERQLHLLLPRRNLKQPMVGGGIHASIMWTHVQPMPASSQKAASQMGRVDCWNLSVVGARSLMLLAALMLGSLGHEGGRSKQYLTQYLTFS